VRIDRSKAITNIFDFLPERQVIKMQQLNKNFYYKVVPSYMGRVRLGCHAINKLFSYGVNDDELWSFDCEERQWTKVKAEFITNEETKAN